MSRLRSFVAAASVAFAFAACDSAQRPVPRAEPTGSTTQGLLALGQSCSSDAQCTTAGTTDGAAHCVDTVCCNSACGGGARDTQACSNIYGTVAGLVPGTCKTLVNGDPCGAIEVGGRCRFKSSVVASDACPAPSGSAQFQACQPCTNNASCPAGRPICDDQNGQLPQDPIDTYFMLDHSQSMGSDCAIPSAGTSRWCRATNALAKYFQAASTTGNRAALQYFTLPGSNCATGAPHDVAAVGLTTLPVTSGSTLITNLTNASPVGGQGTDIESAARGIVKFTTNNQTAGRTMTAVLITDGDPNGCNGNASQLGTILANHLAATGIRTFVIGMTGASASNLEALAVGGGAPSHNDFCIPPATSCHYYSVGNGDPAAFEAALGAIQASVGKGCEACSNNNGTNPASSACPTTAAPVCLNGGCVGCVTSADCVQYNPSTPLCNPTTNTCTQCQTNADCPTNLPICDAGTCNACDGDNGGTVTPHECPTTGNPACITTGPGQGSCVPCTTNAHCPGDNPVCDPVSHTCGECNTNADCSGTTPICNAQHDCVPCDGDNGGTVTPNECPVDHPVCITSGGGAGSCVECTPTNTTHCPLNEPVCNPADNTCVECTTGSQCPSGVCDNASHTCTTPCTLDTDCPAPKPVCNAGICVECTPAKPQKCVDPKPVCDPTTNTCVECTKSSECPKEEPICDPATKTCTATCTTSTQCPGDAPICDPVTKTCVECNTNADCKNGQICDPSTHTCKDPSDGGVDAGSNDGGSRPNGDSGKPNDGTSTLTDEFNIQGAGCDCQLGTTSPSSGTGTSAVVTALAGMIAIGSRRRRRGR